MDIGVLILRIGVGGIMTIHGLQRLLPAKHGGKGMRATTQRVESLGFRPAKTLAWLLATTELVAGFALAVGFGTPFAAAAIVGLMAAAIMAGSRSEGFLTSGRQYEFRLLAAAGALALAYAGAGEWSLDRVLEWQLAGEGYGVMAAVVGVVCAAVTAGARHVRMPRFAGRRPVHG